MKKLLTTALCLIILSLSAQAQGSKIDDFIKKHSSQEGASYVEMSKVMLAATFGENDKRHPQVYKSLVINDISKAAELKQILSSGKYEVLMEMKSEKKERKRMSGFSRSANSGKKEESTLPETYSVTTTYYFFEAAKVDEKEIIIIQQEGDNRVIISYMKGDLDVNNLQDYLINIRTKLRIMNASNSLSLGFVSTGNNFQYDFYVDNGMEMADLSTQ